MGNTDLFEYEEPLGDAGIADALYNKGKEGGQEPRKAPPPLKQGPESDQRIGEALYPPHNDNYPRTDAAGQPEAILRDVDGRIALRGFTDGRSEALAAQYPTALSNMDLRDLELPELPGADLRGADLQGATLGNLQRADIRGIKVSPETDIGQADFTLARLRTEDFEALKQCKGWQTARGLGRPLVE